MRRQSGPRDEQLGQNLRTRREAAGWTARELAEVADQVRLIEIAALDRDAGPAPRRHGGIEPGHESLEPGDSREPLRTHAHLALEPALELPSAEPESGGELPDRDAAMRGSNRCRGSDNAPVRTGARAEVALEAAASLRDPRRRARPLGCFSQPFAHETQAISDNVIESAVDIGELGGRRTAEDCTERGMCTASNGKCAIGKDADCAPLDVCKVEGMCSAVDGKCSATDDAMCQKSAGCNKAGECKADGGRCVAASAEACAESIACRAEGRCGLGEASCVPTGAGDCKGSQLCSTEGRCSFKDGKCVAASDLDCKGSQWCTHKGLCKANTETGTCESG